jgi:hypothetical protein
MGYRVSTSSAAAQELEQLQDKLLAYPLADWGQG